MKLPGDGERERCLLDNRLLLLAEDVNEDVAEEKTDSLNSYVLTGVEGVGGGLSARF